MQVWKRKSMCFLISDFESENYQRSMQLVSKKHQFICALIKDLRESQLPNCGLVEFQDSETGKILTVDTGNPKVRKSFQDRAEKEWNDLHSFFKKNRIDFLNLDTQHSIVNPLIKFFKQRERRFGK